MKTYSSRSIEETRAIASAWLADISVRYADLDEALVVGLSGHLGAGKTAFTKAVAQEMGVEMEVTSPTFVIMKAYEARGHWKRLVHIDAYRLERREELEALDWENVVADKNNLILIEWPENVGLKEWKQSAHLSFDSMGGEYKIDVE